ncbi:MAG: deoxyribonuclease V [Dehalococcoidales bacterium]
MRVVPLHSWQVNVAQALDIQLSLAAKVSKVSEVITPRFIAGMDISAPRAQGIATGAVVILSYPELRLVETQIVNEKVGFPYIPGLLSFRESPLVLAACEKLAVNPDLVLVDGQGVAHPRRMGLASHLGLFLDTPTIGCAKSRLCGSHQVPDAEPGSYAELVDNGEVIGAALRTKLGTSPLYVSIGHKVDLSTAIHWVLECCRNYRIPEPLRLAHLAAGGNLKPEKGALAAEAGYQGKLFA